MAVLLHGHVRPVFDLDVVIASTPDEQNRALHALTPSGFVGSIPIPLNLLTVLRMFDQAEREVDGSSSTTSRSMTSFISGELTMAASLTEKEFSQHVNTKFRVNLDAENSVDLELVEVKGYMSKHNEQTGMERFSIYFQGPSEPYLPQMLYKFQHDQMGEFEIFIVPLSRNERAFRYEAVFNYFKEQ